jgi:hypothetical protein
MQTVIIPNQMLLALNTLRITPEQALTRFLILELTQKLREYRTRCVEFEQHYGVPYQEFTESVNNSPTEDFARSDDRNAWQFAVEAESVIAERLRELQ